MLPAPIMDTDSSPSSVLPDQTCQRFTLSEIQSATNNFDETLVIGRGGFGNVYKCPTKIGSAREVAVKRLHSMSNQGTHEFEAEVQILSKLRHGHNYSTQHGVIHRDVKSSNILLEAHFSAKLSDFGLAKICLIDRTHVSTDVKGTFGYLDPCYFYSGKLTRKSDVYAFGVLLFEVLSGRKAVDSTIDEEQWGLAGWALHKIKQGKLNQIIDPRLIGQISKKCLKEFASIAGRCLHPKPKKRPTMEEVLVKLESIFSQGRESAHSVADEDGFIYKLRSLFTGRDGTANNDQSLRTFTYAELAKATNGFEEEVYSPTLNECIYKGYVDQRTFAPTKCGVGLAMYVRKMEILTWQLDIKLEDFNHPNLVNLLGYCLSNHRLFCVYEDICGITLDKYLYGDPHRTSLSWVARLKIAVGAAEGLNYLHKRNMPAYSHFKTKLILVDKDFNARLSDFAFDCYTFPLDGYYAAPECFRHYQANTFDSLLSQPPENVVLLEILTGMKVYDKMRPFGMRKLVEWAIPLLGDEVNLGMIMDRKLLHKDCPPKGAFILAQLVLNCLQPKLDKRPPMEEILQVLQHCYQEEIRTV